MLGASGGLREIRGWDSAGGSDCDTFTRGLGLSATTVASPSAASMLRMSPTPKGRPNTPSEDANIAPAAGIEVVKAALEYLANPDGLDAGRDWKHLVAPLVASLNELEAMESSYSMTEKVNAADVEIFARADVAADNVKTHTRADDVQVRIGSGLERFRSLWRSAERGV